MKFDDMVRVYGPKEEVKAEPSTEVVVGELMDADENEFGEALSIINDTMKFLDYLADPKLCTTITWPDRQEMSRFVDEMKLFLDDYDLPSYGVIEVDGLDEVELNKDVPPINSDGTSRRFEDKSMEIGKCKYWLGTNCIQSTPSQEHWCKYCKNLNALNEMNWDSAERALMGM